MVNAYYAEFPERNQEMNSELSDPEGIQPMLPEPEKKNKRAEPSKATGDEKTPFPGYPERPYRPVGT